MFCYWLVSTLFGLLVPPAPQSAATRGSALDIAETALLSGALFLTFGAAMGSLGGRSVRARAGISGAFGGLVGWAGRTKPARPHRHSTARAVPIRRGAASRYARGIG